jgi:hypothetical protein
MNMKDFIAFATCAAVAMGCTRGDDDREGYEKTSIVRVGDALPEFAVFNGADTVTTAQLAGKKTLIALFVTTCGDCQKALPVIDSAWRELRDEPGVVFVLASRGEQLDAVAAYWAEAGFATPFYLDEQRDMFNKFATAYTPRVYLADGRQRVTEMHVEVFEMNSEELCRRVRALESGEP